MKFSSYNTFLYDLDKQGLEYAAERAERLGFSGVELLDLCPLRSRATYERYSVDEYRAAFDRHSLELACYSSAALLYTDDEKATLAEIGKQAEFAAALGSKIFHHTFTIGFAHTPKTLAFDTVLNRVASMAERVAEKCDRLGMTCIYEPQGAYFNGEDGFFKLRAEMKRRGVNTGVCADVGNSLFFDEKGEDIIKKCASDVMHVHAKDYIMSDEPLPLFPNNQISNGGKHLYDCEIGTGVVNFLECFKPLKEIGYDGYFSIELVADDESNERMIKYMKNIYEN